jgi:hypothetical protein
MWHVWGRREVHPGFDGKHERRRPIINGRIILKGILDKCDWRTWIGLIWLRIGTVVGLL